MQIGREMHRYQKASTQSKVCETWVTVL